VRQSDALLYGIEPPRGETSRRLMDVIPAKDAFVSASKTQLERLQSSTFRATHCRLRAFSESILHEHIAYDSTIGVRGCDKQSTYMSTCVYTGYAAGKHTIKCQSIVIAAGDWTPQQSRLERGERERFFNRPRQ
jgi:hypothetical protein